MSTSGGISLDHFHARLTVLQKQHQSLKAADLEMRATQSERCRSSLEKAVKSLFHVITLVRKHDKRLVAWHDRSPHLKSALRLIGIDRRTEHTVNKTTAKLKNGVHKVETQFEYAGQVIGESIDDTTRFQKDFSQISHSGVEENLQAMRAAEAELKKELEDLKYQIQNQDVECSGAMAELTLQIQRLEKLTADHDSARAWKNTWGAVTVLAAAGAFAMPVVGISVGIVAGVKTLMNSEQQEALRVKKEQHELLVQSHDSELKSLQLQMAQSGYHHDSCAHYMDQIKQIQSANLAIRQESSIAFKTLCEVQMALEKARLNIFEISQELQECQYEKTRRGMAARLDGILKNILQFPAKAKLKAIDQKLIEQATGGIRAISDSTAEVMAIVVAKLRYQFQMASYNGRTINSLTGESNATGQASADIIALHGLGGDWNRTWSSFGYCWLKHALVPKFPSCRILSLNYPDMLSTLSAHPPDINGLIHDIIRDRRQENRSKSPIIFFGHSFGGTVLKQVYVATHPSNTDDPEYKALHSQIRGYVFFGTIHKDRDMSRAKLEVPEFWRALSRGASGTLGGHSHELEKAMYTTFRVNHAFRRLGGENLLINCFYETKGPGGLSRRVLMTQEESTLVSRPAPTMPLDLDHQSLVCFKSPRDENLARVLDALDSFMIRAMDVESRLHRPIAPESRGLCLLSLDGGGVKGLFSIIVIDRLMQETRRLEGPGAEQKKPCNYFDLIGGTSTGGLLAIMLGRLQMDTQLCIQAYKSLSKEVFSRKFKVPFLESFRKASNVALSWSWFDGDKLKEAVCRTVKENLLPSDSAMLRQSGCTVEDLTLITDMKSATYSFVCAVPKYEEKVKRIRSYEPLDQQTNAPAERFKIWEAARATSAAPMYFPHIEAGGVSYFDGGLESNNPVIEVIEEAKQEFPDDKISTVISVGTGAYQASDASAGLAGFMNYMINMATSTEKHHRAVLEDPRFADIRKEGYFRLNGTLELGAIDLAAVERMDEIERLAEAFLSSNEGQQQIGMCAERLVERARHQ
ncbi:calcium-independent phospholipase [Fusarium mundagurra]|uniref:Calcium-independent phospholipase n=1 Tax=Fusarium mundagurra TaxID=1567541 RepID=A0A8H5YKC9_9HYPO|nr:calcium-independent phospholipase [Fusarium mundagurra]